MYVCITICKIQKCIKRVFGRIGQMLYTCYNEGRIQIQFHRCFTLYYRLYDTESMNYFYRRNTPHRHLFLNMFLSETCKVSTYI